MLVRLVYPGCGHAARSELIGSFSTDPVCLLGTGEEGLCQ